MGSVDFGSLHPYDQTEGLVSSWLCDPGQLPFSEPFLQGVHHTPLPVRGRVHEGTQPSACSVDGPRCIIPYYYIVTGTNSIRTNPH